MTRRWGDGRVGRRGGTPGQESAENYESFLLYLRMGPRRSIAKVAAGDERDERYLERVRKK